MRIAAKGKVKTEGKNFGTKTDRRKKKQTAYGAGLSVTRTNSPVRLEDLPRGEPGGAGKK